MYIYVKRISSDWGDGVIGGVFLVSTRFSINSLSSNPTKDHP
jgi:hypothetical protein